jgi:O-acetyl-ADP-ribose deacetylase (regulator of RNase III)
MRIQYIQGDLIESSEYVIAHGCNAQGVMKSGIAKTIREQYPLVFEDYWHTYESQGDYLRVGSVIPTVYPDRIILSIISQEYYGRDHDTRYVSYDAIAKAIVWINENGYTRVAFPKIGAGLGNGKWSIISNIIESYSEFTPVVYHTDS